MLEQWAERFHESHRSGFVVGSKPSVGSESEKEYEKKWSKRPSLQKKECPNCEHMSKWLSSRSNKSRDRVLLPDRAMSSEHSHSHSARSGPVSETESCNVGALVGEESKKENRNRRPFVGVEHTVEETCTDQDRC